MLHLFTDDVRRNPFPLYAQMRAAAPVLQAPGSDVWALFGYDGVRRALHDPEVFSSRAAPPGDSPLDWLIFQDPPLHTKLRAIVMRAFTPKAVAALEPRIRDLASELLDAHAASGAMDLARDFASPLPLLVIAEMIGIPVVDRPLFQRWGDAILGLANTIGSIEEKQRAVLAFRTASDEMRPYLGELLARRRVKPQDDLLTRIVEAEVDGEHLSPDEMLGFFQLLLLAGSETTTNLISNTVLCLTENPDQYARLRESPDMLPQALEEVLRYRTPVQAVFRQTRREVELQGRRIPADKLVLVMIGSANRDAAHFDDPDRFDIGRDPNPHVAFGHGIHFCLGAPLARLEGRIALSLLLERVKDMRLASTDPWPPRQAFNVHGPSSLPIRFRPA